MGLAGSGAPIRPRQVTVLTQFDHVPAVTCQRLQVPWVLLFFDWHMDIRCMSNIPLHERASSNYKSTASHKQDRSSLSPGEKVRRRQP